MSARGNTITRLWSRASSWGASLFRRGPEIETAVVATYPRELTVYGPGEAPVPLQAHAAARWSGAQSWLPSFVQDACNDISPGDRLEIVRRARYFEEWSSLFVKALHLIDTNVVGTGIMPTPDSASKRFNRRALDYWNEVVPVLDITESLPFYDAESIIATRRAADGEIFTWLTWADPDEMTVPRIKLIETHRIVSAGVKRYADEGYVEFDGMLFDPRGRPEFYIVSNDHDAFSTRRPERVVLVPRSQMVHFFRPRRAGQPRGLSLFAPVLHDVHDLDDLQQFEMIASKDAAEIVRKIWNEAGEAPPVNKDGTAIKRRVQVPQEDGSVAQREVVYKRTLGGRTLFLKHGDKMEADAPARPNAVQMEFWDRIERKFSQGTGLSLAAIMDYAGQWGGAAARGAVASDNRFYDQQVWSLVPGLQRVYEHVIAAGIRAGRFGVVPSDWRKCSWKPPRRATVDIGRDGKQLLEELRAGLRTEREIIGELGYSYLEVRGQRVKEVSERLADAEVIAKEHKLPVMTAYSLLASVPPGIYAAALADQEITDAKPAPTNGKNNPKSTAAAA